MEGLQDAGCGVPGAGFIYIARVDYYLVGYQSFVLFFCPSAV